jgi:hypothetical protein
MRGARSFGPSSALLAPWLLVACVQEQRYAIENQAVALTADAQPAAVDEDDDPIFIVTRDFELPITPPPANELQRLTGAAQGATLPFPRLPWVELHDLELQLDYALANQSDGNVLAMVIVNGRNEFNVYTPGPEDFNQWERRFALGPRERVTGTITELELDEIAIDLATVVNGAPNSNQVVHFQSQSGRDDRIDQFIPGVVPGLIGLTAGIQAGAAANVVLEISVRVQDHGGRAAARGKRSWQPLPEPVAFVPVAVEEE